MNVKSIFIALTVASIMTLGLPVRAADPVGPTRAEKSFDDCTINARLKFKDGKGGCVANHPAFFEQQNVHTLYKNPQFTHAVSLRPAQCPAVFGWTYNTAGGGTGGNITNDIGGSNATSAVSSCNDKIRRAIGTDSPKCNCKVLDEIAKGMSKEEFYDFERNFSSRVTVGWKPADLLNPTNLAQVPAAPDNPNVQRLTPVPLGKADVNAAETAADERRVKEALAKLAEDRRLREAKAAADEQRIKNETLAKLAEERLQRIALAKAEEDARIKAAVAKVEADRLQKEAAAKLEEEKLQRIALAKAEEVRSQKEALAKAEENQRKKESDDIALLRSENERLRQQIARPNPSVVPSSIRKALIMGNDNYKFIAKLSNAREDAKALAESLSKFGYAVSLKTDLTEKEMKAALRVFKSQVNPGDEVTIFYAGHGVQLGAANYILPIDVSGDNEEQLKDEAIPWTRILDDMTERKAKFTLAVLDACRDNPFKVTGRSIGGGTRGLAPTSAATGQMIVFSAGTGQQALDSLGLADKSKNGLFMRVFNREIQKPGVSIDRLVRNVRNEVVSLAKTIGHEQVPAIYDQVVGEFFFSN